MRSFKIPFDLNNEDKIIGGYLTLKQGGFAALFGGLALCSLVLPIGGNLVQLITGKLGAFTVSMKIAAFIFFAVTGLLFMFAKPGGQSFYKFLIILVKYVCRNKTIYPSK